MAWDFDVAVIGGGPAGSSAATALARRGKRVILFERERFPRFHIGESQLPWIHEVLGELGASEKVDAAGFVRKWGASFTTENGDADQYADFAVAPEIRRPQTWQVPRAIFDELLLKHSAECGVHILQERTAEDVAFDNSGVTITHSSRGNDRQTVRVGAVVDASGRAGIIAKRFGERRKDPLLQNIAVHRQYEGIPRPEGRRAGDIRMVTRPDCGWFWFIPITDTIISVGAVVPQSAYAKKAKPTAEETLDGFLAETPAAARLMAGARPVTPARFDADYSYLHSQHAGDRFVIVGDAGAFLDPIFSTGVLLGMQSGIDAAAALCDALDRGDLRRSRFAAYERNVVRRYHYFRRFAVGFYDPGFRELFFSRSSRFGIYEAVLSVLAGNSSPSWRIRLRLQLFLALVALQKFVPLTRRRNQAKIAVAQ